MKPYLEACEDQIEEILDEFDFGKVHNVMTHLGWTWQGKDIPTVGDLRREARRLLWEAVSRTKGDWKGAFTTGIGGFRVFVNKGVDAKGYWVRLRLAFEVTDWESDDEKKIAYKP